MDDYGFILILRQDVDAYLTPGPVLDALFEAGCDDGSFGVSNGVPDVVFTRGAASYAEAVLTAIRDVESVLPGSVLRVEPDDLFTASEIAERLGRTRESVRLLIAGKRGPGGFPPPQTHLRTRSPLWRWADVAAWARTAGIVVEDDPTDVDFLAALNAALRLRELGPRLGQRGWASIATFLPGSPGRFERTPRRGERGSIPVV